MGDPARVGSIQRSAARGEGDLKGQSMHLADGRSELIPSTTPSPEHCREGPLILSIAEWGEGARGSDHEASKGVRSQRDGPQNFCGVRVRTPSSSWVSGGGDWPCGGVERAAGGIFQDSGPGLVLCKESSPRLSRQGGGSAACLLVARARPLHECPQQLAPALRQTEQSETAQMSGVMNRITRPGTRGRCLSSRRKEAAPRPDVDGF